ncbi:MAG: ATP-dependent DNA helicase, partial [Saezia sp.]
MSCSAKNLASIESSSVIDDAVIKTFSSSGALCKADPGFCVREYQTQFALTVAHTIFTHQGKLVVEAGTGTGKTYAYLVPVLLSGRKALISTATKSLQDQLFLRDLPHVRRALNMPISIALLKGRNNYLCLHRLELAQTGGMTFTAKEQRDLTRVIFWAQGTKTGDMAEVTGLDERSPVIAIVTSTRENCLGSECPQFHECYLMQARKAAMAADVVVVNHHLFFADLAVRESGVAELLPTVEMAIFDEAHQLNEAGLQFLGESWSTSQTLDFLRDALTNGLMFARGLYEWQALSSAGEQAVRDFRLLAKKIPANTRLAWNGKVPDEMEQEQWESALNLIGEKLEELCDALKEVAAAAPDLNRLFQRGTLLRQKLHSFSLPKASESIRWVEVGGSLKLIESPLDIALAMQERCFSGAQSWVFTSATLGEDESLSWFTEQVGLTDAVTMKLNSPFDYPEQAAIYVPENFPRPNDAEHGYAVSHMAAKMIEALGGRAFVLTTTLRALKLIGEELTNYFSEQGSDIQVLVQGSRPKRDLLEAFRNGASRSVLVGSHSF